ncbi:uncharacterized protein LOC130949921 [Arachis stenosperma]|uniref:uncharacterized protein LOC130949921 n=1 Tax=Arachis stenosperma TaxID=217475 RepID=UPI0025ABF3AA|nr:uncharacterized protein LOC130949921 [Arachis stenosperma]
MAQSKHIDKVLDRHSDETISNNRLRLKTYIDAIRWIAFQACAFRGGNESPGSLNRGNFIKLNKLLASRNQNVNNVILENFPGNTQYISPGVQKDILHIFARKVRGTLREEIEISSVLFHHNLDVQNLRGQAYDGASNMRGELNELQALLLKDCPFAYYIHCLAHRLELALISAAKELRVAQASNVANLIANDQIVTGSGLNQRVENTRWESHLNSVRSLLCIFYATCEVLQKTLKKNVNGFICDFSDQEKFHIRMQAQHYELDVPNHVELTNLCTISELCQGLTKTGKSFTYHLIDRLIRLVLTLPVSTVTIERSFSAMNIVKNRLRNKIEDEILTNCLLIYIEKIAERFDTDLIIKEFYDIKNRCISLR